MFYTDRIIVQKTRYILIRRCRELQKLQKRQKLQKLQEQ